MKVKEFDDSEAWIRVLDNISAGIVVTEADGSIRHINSCVESILGISSHAAKGKRFRDLFYPNLPAEKCWVSSAMATGDVVRDHRFEVETSQVEKRALVANFTPVDLNNASAGALIEIRRTAESDELTAEREKRKAILDSLTEGLFTVDNELNITSFNRTAEHMTGWKEDEILGKPCKQVFDCGQCANGCPLVLTLSRSKPAVNYKMDICNRRGNRLLVELSSAILYHSRGQAIGAVVCFRDHSLQHRVSNLMIERTHFHGLVGQNKHMLELYTLIEDIADSNATVLILGESGTGKELVANAIQRLSPRKDKPFVQVNCGAIPENLVESELFGHVRGAFTGAYTDRSGRFEIANGGTVFLDEIGDLTGPAQVRLLRVLEKGEFQKVGSSKTTKVNVRVLAASNHDIWNMVLAHEFRKDLYYRLNVIPIKLPPLRERLDDLPYLVDYFMARNRRITRKNITCISKKVSDLLVAHDYPGNVRELQNIIEHACARTKDSMIDADNLPSYLHTLEARRQKLHRDKKDEGTRIRNVLIQCSWNRGKAAEMLGIDRTTLWRRMRELDIS